MNSDMTATTFGLPRRIDSVFRALRMGRHLCRDDGEDFYDVQREEERYTAVFKALGYNLVHHTQGFYYFTGQSTLHSKRLRAATLFMLILFQDLEDNKFNEPERSWERTLLNRQFKVNELPHFSTGHRRMLMHAVGITRDNLETKLLRFLTQLGVIELSGGVMHFRPPVYRFVDLFLQYADDEQWQRRQDAAQEAETVEGDAGLDDGDGETELLDEDDA